MKKFFTLTPLITLLFSSNLFALPQVVTEEDAPCALLAKACVAAGFERMNEHKQLWHGCMQPALLGKAVKNLNLDAQQIKACRAQKIIELQAMLKELQSVK